MASRRGAGGGGHDDELVGDVGLVRADAAIEAAGEDAPRWSAHHLRDEVGVLAEGVHALEAGLVALELHDKHEAVPADDQEIVFCTVAAAEEGAWHFGPGDVLALGAPDRQAVVERAGRK